MVRRTRDIQKKIWLTPQEERTIAKKMEMIGTENFGAYARKMLIDGYIIVVDYTVPEDVYRPIPYPVHKSSPPKSTRSA